jgi:hypothetical protein
MIPRQLVLRAAELMEQEAARILMMAGPRPNPKNFMVRQREELVAIALELRRHAGE